MSAAFVVQLGSRCAGAGSCNVERLFTSFLFPFLSCNLFTALLFCNHFRVPEELSGYGVISSHEGA